MRLSTKSKYSLEALVMLSHLSKNKERISIKAIAEKTDISEGYLEQLFSLMKKHDLIESKKGKSGGYRLKNSADTTSVDAVLSAVEGPLAPVRCVETHDCDRENECETRRMWAQANDIIHKTFKGITIAHLTKDYERRLEAEART